jgi:aldose 1-epimerase
MQRLTLLLALLFAAVPAADSAVQKSVFGTPKDGTTIDAYTLTNQKGASAKIITFGAIIAELNIPDHNGKSANMVKPAVFTEENYTRGFPQAAIVVGRFINRIAGAKFTLDGKEYTLANNSGPNHIHGGRKNFAKVIWQAEPVAGKNAVRLTYRSVDGEEGYPGNLDATVVYTLTDDNTLRIDYSATSDKPTPVNLSNHAYFNLGGQGDVRAHEMWINAQLYTPSGEGLIPTGEIARVEGTPLDFRQPLPLGARADQLKQRPFIYDNNYVLDRREPNVLAPAARVTDPASGRVMEVWTTEPGVQLYTSQLGGPNVAANGFFCLETQHFPDAVNKPHFPSTILRPGQTYQSTTEFRFSAK